MTDRLGAHLARPILRLAARWAFAPGADWRRRRWRLELLARGFPPPRATTVLPLDLHGMPGERVFPAGRPAPARLLYLHGGGYATGSPRTHRALAARLAGELDAAAFVPDYRLAPEHPFPAAYDDAVACYTTMAHTAGPDAPLVIAGDSAGGGLALAVALAAREKGLRAPSAVVLISPWLDLTRPIASSRGEPILTPGLVAAFAEAYVPDIGQRSDLRVSPLLADLRDLPRLHIESGAADPLLDQALDLEHAARAAGVSVTHTVHRGLWHAFHATPIPASRRAISGIARALSSP